MPRLDHTDKRIIDTLGNDCRTPYREIAKSLGMSATAIKSRVDDMIASGVIIDFLVEFSPAMVGSEFVLFWLETDSTEGKEQIVSEFAAKRGVIQITVIHGGGYVVVAEYTSSAELAALAEALRSNAHVVSTEMHTLLTPRGKKTSLTNLQFRVLKALLKDPRMMTSDIARETGLTVRLVRKTLRELKQSEAINFSFRLRLNVGNRVTFLLKIRWDPKQVSREGILHMLTVDHQDELWEILPSATDPLLIVAATVDSLNSVDTMTAKIRSYPGVVYSEAFIYRPSYRYKSIKRLYLEEAVQAAGV